MEQINQNKNFKFIKSDIAEKIKNLVKNNSDFLNNIDEYNKSVNTDIFKLDKNIVKHSLIKICDFWNKDIKSRNFLKHLIDAYYNISSLNKVNKFTEEQIKNNQNICSIMNFKLCGIYDLSTVFGNYVIDKIKIDLLEDKEEKQKAIDNYNQKIQTVPLEIRMHRFAYYSDKSNKFLSAEAYTSLIHLFVINMLLFSDKEMTILINKITQKLFNFTPKFNKHNLKRTK